MNTLHGVFPPMLTPFTQSGDVDFDAHVRNIGRWNRIELGGCLVLGSNSETPYLNESEKLKLVELTMKHTAKERIVLAGTGLESTRETIRLTKVIAGLGVHAALVLTPNFYGSQMNDEALINHFQKVADASRIPIFIYNVPAYTRLVISIDAVKALSKHSNIIGMKDSSGDVPRLAALKNVVPPSFNLIVGTASAWYPALTLGIKAGILALANFAGTQCARVQRLFEEGKQEDANVLHLRLVPVNTAVTSTYGIAGLKYATSLLGYDGGFVRSPLLELNEKARKDIKRLVESAGLAL